MTFSLTTKRFNKSCYIQIRKYCDGKSIYQRDEEGEKPRTVYGKLYPDWRKPWIKRDGEYQSKLSVFVENNPKPEFLYAMQKIPKLTAQEVKDWWEDVKVIYEITNQQFLKERVAILGSNLAAVHFFTYRNSPIRLRNGKNWISGDITKYGIPDQYVDGYYVEAVDCSKFTNGIRYEGLQNLANLSFLRWLSLRDQFHIDVWCLDRLAGLCGKSLEFLDISGCNLCVGGVQALSRIQPLKYLVVTDPKDNLELQAALSLLEESKKDLSIKTVSEKNFAEVEERSD